jgi:NAD(P)-dependent dehydrogenase (short-subunit alcohol dehydrogenase family)
MINHQHPLGSGFTASSTATTVAAGIDLAGRNVVITAGHVGLGLETTRALSAAGATVTVGARDPEQAAKALAGIERVEVAALDLIDPASVNAFAAHYVASGRPLHVLIGNAGIMGGDLVRDTRGYEQQFAINHLGHFQLANALLPALREAHGARVIAVSSWGHYLSDIHWDDVHFVTHEYDGMIAYGQSKTANVLFAVELDRRWSADGIRGYAVHPGNIVSTNLAPWIDRDTRRAMGLLDDAGHPIIDPDRDLKTTEQGAATAVFAATSPLLADIGGVYLQNSDIAQVDDAFREADPSIAAGPIGMKVGVTPYAVNPDSARRLWELSMQAL